MHFCPRTVLDHVIEDVADLQRSCFLMTKADPIAEPSVTCEFGDQGCMGPYRADDV